LGDAVQFPSDGGLVLAGVLAPTGDGPLVVGVWLVLATGVVGALALLHRSGVPFVTRFLSWRVEDKRVLRQLMRDVYWFRRP
jgi:membrane protein DedA with SNARE-associated domain